MWPLAYIDMLYHDNPELLAVKTSMVLVVALCVAMMAHKVIFERKMKKYLGPRWGANVGWKLKQHDQKLANALADLNKAREELESHGMTDDYREAVAGRFRVCRASVKYWRKERDRAYSKAFDPRAGRGEEAEERIRAGLPPATLAGDKQTSAE